MLREQDVSPAPRLESPKRKLNLRSLLRALDHIEIQMAEFYAWLSSVMDDPEAVWFFARMSRQEESHRDLVSFEARLAESSGSEFDMIAVDISDLQDALTHTDWFKADFPRPTLEQALDFAIKMESRAAEQHYKTALAKIDSQTGSMIKALARADDAHVEEIRRFRNRAIKKKANRYWSEPLETTSQ